MPKPPREFYPIGVYAKERGHTVEELLHAAAMNGYLALSVYANNWPFSYGKWVEAKDSRDGFKPAVHGKEAIDAPIRLRRQAVKELYFQGETAHRIFAHTVSGYVYWRLDEERIFTVKDIIITVSDAAKFEEKIQQTPKIVSSAKRENECYKWLCAMIASGPKTKPKIGKTDCYFKDAREKFSGKLTRNSFIRAWDKATKDHPEWRIAGRRRSKSIQQINSPIN